MSEWKEVWYVWDGVGEPPNDATGIKLQSGTTTLLDNIMRVDWSIIGHDSDVAAYTLGQKRRRVVCGGCFGQGEISCILTRPTGTITCPCCNGTGKGWEYSV